MSPPLVTFASVFLLFSSSAFAEPSVDISISPATTVRLGDKVRVACYVAGLQPENFVFKLRLFCPILSNNLACFQNCKPTCQEGTGCTAHQTNLMSSMRCDTYRGTDKLQFFYEFPYNAVEYSGHYMCQFFGKDSARALLPKPIIPPTTSPAKITDPKKPVQKTTIRTSISPTKPTEKATTIKPAVRPETKSPWCGVNGEYCDPPYSTAGDSTRERLLVLVIILLLISAIVNSIFCIRCVLINQYAKNPQRLQRMGYCMSGFLCLDPEVYLRKREPSLVMRAGCSASLMASHVHDDAGGSDSTYSMPAYLPVSHHGHARSQTLPSLMAAPANDSQKNIVFIPVVASSLSHLQASGSQPGLNYPLGDVVHRQFVTGAGGGGGDRGVGSSTRCLAVSPQPPPVPKDRLSTSVTKLNGRMTGRHLSGDSTREADEEETLIE